MPSPRSLLASALPAAARRDFGEYGDDAPGRFFALVNPALMVWAWVTVPRQVDGTLRIAALVLLAVVSVVLVLRLFRPPAIGPSLWFPVMLGGAIAAGVLFAVAPGGVAPAFAPVIAGASGFLFETRRALVVAGVASITAAVGMVTRFDDARYAWVVVLGLAVLVGMTRRDRVRTLVLMREKIEQTDRAIASEARAQVLAERARVAREIHDVLAHSLSGVNMQLNLVEALMEDGRDDDARVAVATARSLVTDGLGEARRAVYALRDESGDLVGALRPLVAGTTESVAVEGTPRPVDADVVAHLTRIVGEALTNARRHAPGSPAHVSVVFALGLLTVSVENATPTGDPRFLDGAGLGLTGMRERADEIGATLVAGPRVDGDLAGGWLVRVEVTT
ncbi:sensor histidine kinase [Williamsia serinedens]|uniref:histidine kinase n=1 Tax=Williamsia serinedens TaxID=391736 RepID=A0ABT1H001_9NOCA|nr:histidine kinase [Williamsia serinedens]MCP2159843.1 Signal transduction histidine kinase [Williamsia serinedens]